MLSLGFSVFGLRIRLLLSPQHVLNDCPESMHTPTRRTYRTRNPFVRRSRSWGGNSNFNQMRPILVPFGHTCADHKVLYHLLSLGDIPENPILRSEIKSKATAERVQLLPESDKIFITLWPHIIGMRPSSPSPTPIPYPWHWTLWTLDSGFGHGLGGHRTQCAADDVECCSCRRTCSCCCC